MGAFCSQDESPEQAQKRKDDARKSRDVEKQLAAAQAEETKIFKLLLLGAGESGKSTLFKQMISIHGKGFPEAERIGYKQIIHGNIIQSAKVLAQQSIELANTGENTTPEDPANATIRDWILSDELNEQKHQIDSGRASRLTAFWKDPGIQRTYDLRSRYQLTDSTKYFFDNIDRISANNYIPSEADVLRSRVRTTGIVENAFVIEGNHFKMFDVGGQRNERKKWIHCFQDVTAVLFVAAMSEYDQVLFEDNTVNRMHEALALFEEICNSRWFVKTSMILMLNKRDIFNEKVEAGIPITTAFPEYDGPLEYKACSEYIQHTFESKKKKASKNIYTHITCATDKNNIAHVFNAVKDIVIRESLREGGLIP